MSISRLLIETGSGRVQPPAGGPVNGNDLPRPALRAELSSSGDVRTVMLDGEIDPATAPVLEHALQRLQVDSAAVVDMRNVSYMDSTGLAIFIRQAMKMREAGGSLHLRDPLPVIRRVIEFCCLESLLEPADSQ
jgi:anti-anti-sigma factor